MTENQKKSNYLDILQVFRGFAALMVVVHHTAGSLRYYHGVNNVVLDLIGNVGKFGVDFFFVLSGFIIAYSAHLKYNTPNAFREYVLARVLRIYIPYLPIGIAMLLLYSLLPGFSNSDRDISIFTSLTLMPNGNPALSVAWTLLYELMFYFLFSMTFFSKRVWNCFLVVWATILILHNYTSFGIFDNLNNPALKLFLSLYNIEFALGYLLAQFVISEIVWNRKVVFFLIVVFSGLFLVDIYYNLPLFSFSKNVLFALFTFFTLYFSVTYLNITLEKKNLLMLIGNATYSIYLIHNPLQMLIVRGFPEISSTIMVIFALLISIGVCCVMGYIYYIVFEKWGIKKVKSIIDNKIKTV